MNYLAGFVLTNREV